MPTKPNTPDPSRNPLVLIGLATVAVLLIVIGPFLMVRDATRQSLAAAAMVNHTYEVGSTINALIRCGSETDVHAGDSWPAELWVVNNYAAVSVQFKSFPYWEDVSVLVPGVAGVVTQVEIPASSAVARICIRRLPPRVRGSVAAPAVPWIVTVEHAG